MKLRHAKIKNFRLLADVQLALEDLTTVVVGRNNSGKTSLSEIIRQHFNSKISPVPATTGSARHWKLIIMAKMTM